MRKLLMSLFLPLVCLSAWQESKKTGYDVTKNDIRPPAYPLITIDPYTSGWATTDNLYDGNVKHWTGTDLPLIGAIKVDDKVYRFMGQENKPMVTVISTSEQGKWTGKYTTTKPGNDWTKKDFNDSSWKTGEGAFGTSNELTAKTNWDSEFIWVRRVIDIKEDLSSKNVYLEYSHDDDVIIFVNGIEVVNTGNKCKKNALAQLPDDMKASLKQGENIITAYCHNRVGGGLLDFGLVMEKEIQTYLTQAAVQKSVDVQATQTHYTFGCGPVDLKITFTAPMFMDDLKLLSRPVNYISYEVASNDGASHDINVYFEASTAWAVDKPLQMSTLEGFEDGDLFFLKTGSVDQKILAKWGDDVKIDWGYFYMAADKKNTTFNIGDAQELRANFADNKVVQSTEKRESSTEKLALIRNIGSVKDAVCGKIMLGYDDIYSIQYFGENLRPYWNSDNFTKPMSNMIL